MKIFTELDTEKFFDAKDHFYRQFWDSQGSLHWGYFDDLNSEDFFQACRRWNEYMLNRSNIGSDAMVLDVGCGNGNTAVWLAQKTHCKVTGIDISLTRIQNAINYLKKFSGLEIIFRKSSATCLPFCDDTFTHVWSQAVLYRVQEREIALKEIHRVLKKGGIFVFDDLVQPKLVVGEDARKYIYDRLLFKSTFDQESYINKLTELGFVVLEVSDLSRQLKRNYQVLSRRVKPVSEEISIMYQKICKIIDRSEVGWSFFLCKKV